jgi:hypothetical protein
VWTPIADADPRLRARHVACRREKLEPRAHGDWRVVWPGEARDEIANDPITHETLDESVTPDEDLHAGGIEAVHDPGEIRGTEALGEWRGAADVRKPAVAAQQ